MHLVGHIWKDPLAEPHCRKTPLPFVTASIWEIGSKWVLLTPTQELRTSSASEGYQILPQLIADPLKAAGRCFRPPSISQTSFLHLFGGSK